MTQIVLGSTGAESVTERRLPGRLSHSFRTIDPRHDVDSPRVLDFSNDSMDRTLSDVTEPSPMRLAKSHRTHCAKRADPCSGRQRSIPGAVAFRLIAPLVFCLLAAACSSDTADQPEPRASPEAPASTGLSASPEATASPSAPPSLDVPAMLDEPERYEEIDGRYVAPRLAVVVFDLDVDPTAVAIEIAETYGGKILSLNTGLGFAEIEFLDDPDPMLEDLIEQINAHPGVGAAELSTVYEVGLLQASRDLAHHSSTGR